MTKRAESIDIPRSSPSRPHCAWGRGISCTSQADYKVEGRPLCGRHAKDTALTLLLGEDIR